MISDPGPPPPPTEPVTLTEATRADLAVPGNLGQLFRYDMSETYRLLPNSDGTFDDRQLDQFLTGTDPGRRAWLIHVAGRLGGFAHVRPWAQGGTSVTGFLVVRALRRTGVGRTAAVGAAWTSHDEPPLPDRPADTWITFDTTGTGPC